MVHLCGMFVLWKAMRAHIPTDRYRKEVIQVSI